MNDYSPGEAVKVITSPQYEYEYTGESNVVQQVDFLELPSGELLVGSNYIVATWCFADNQPLRPQRELFNNTSSPYHNTTILVDETRFVTRQPGSVRLCEVLDGVVVQQVLHYHNAKVRIWRDVQYGALIVLWNSLYFFVVWRLDHKEPLEYRVNNVGGVFDDGLYCVRTGRDLTVGVRNYFDDLRHPLMRDINNPMCTLETASASVDNLIRLNSGNFVATHHRSAPSLWNGERGSLIRELYGHSSNEISLKKRKGPEGGFLTGGVEDKIIRGWNDDGECLFIFKAAHQAIDSIYELSNGTIACGDGRRLEIWNPRSVYVYLK